MTEEGGACGGRLWCIGFAKYVFDGECKARRRKVGTLHENFLLKLKT